MKNCTQQQLDNNLHQIFTLFTFMSKVIRENDVLSLFLFCHLRYVHLTFSWG